MYVWQVPVWTVEATWPMIWFLLIQLHCPYTYTCLLISLYPFGSPTQNAHSFLRSKGSAVWYHIDYLNVMISERWHNFTSVTLLTEVLGHVLLNFSRVQGVPKRFGSPPSRIHVIDVSHGVLPGWPHLKSQPTYKSRVNMSNALGLAM